MVNDGGGVRGRVLRGLYPGVSATGAMPVVEPAGLFPGSGGVDGGGSSPGERRFLRRRRRGGRGMGPEGMLRQVVRREMVGVVYIEEEEG